MGTTKLKKAMSNQVDKLFKDKLDAHQVTPSPAAWDKLERQLAKKNSGYVWMRAAAVLALFALGAVVALNWSSKPVAEVVKVGDKQPVQQDPAPLQPEPNITPAPPREQVAEKKKPAPRKEAVQQELEQPVEQVIEETLTPVEMIVIATPVEVPAPEVLQPADEPASKPVVIVYSLPPVAKKDATPAVEEAEEKKKGFQRVLEVAKDVKYADNPFGELREAKNDLFALEFRRDKDKNKNNN